MRAAFRRSRFLVLLTALVTTVALVTPLGQTARAADVGTWVSTAHGQIRIESVTPAKASYGVGDVVTVVLRMESNAEAPQRDITGTSATLSNPASCDWKAFPAGVAGKYNCARTAKPALTYTVTPADAVAGVANFSLTYTETPVNAAGDPDGVAVTSTIDGSLPVNTAALDPRPEGEYVALATAGDYGFSCHRIPALTTAPNGDVLASWDGRLDTCQDAPQANSILQRRSTDGGQTWGDVTTVAAGKPTPVAEKYGFSDPSYVVDRETGHIFNFFVKSFDQGFQGSQAGTAPDARNVLHAAVTTSTDNGLTWSVPRVITSEITDSPTWISRFAASGEGIQLRYAPHKGRLVQQFTIKDDSVYKAMSVYSDDHGATWQNGAPVGTGMDENKTVELSDGRVMLNSRASDGTKARKVTISTDGGETYGPVTVDTVLIDPNNNASIMRAYPNAAKNSAQAKILLFSNAANTAGRSNGTVRISFDDGQTWAGSRVFEPGDMQYSTLTALTKEGTYGLFYEGQNTQMRYMTISMDWLNVQPTSTPTATVTAPAVTPTSTTTSTATATATSSTTATVTSTTTATSTTTVTATATVTATVTATQTQPSATPTQRPVNVYTDPGYHTVNGRQWFTNCEPYSATTRCFTSIWASQVQTVNGKQKMVTGWTFNNLTYLPMARQTWKGNELAFTNEWTATDGRKWRTECDTAVTGGNGCRSYTWSTVHEATSTGATTFRAVNKWVFNNIVMFT